MAFTEDLTAYLTDFGVPCSKGATNFTAIFDQPDEMIGFTAADMISRSYTITYITTDVALAAGDAVVVNGNNFTVQQVISQDDGSMSVAGLKK